jgi:hypothetical protein
MVTKTNFSGKSLNATLQKALQKNSRLWMWQYQTKKNYKEIWNICSILVVILGTVVPRTGRNMKIRRVYLSDNKLPVLQAQLCKCVVG